MNYPNSPGYAQGSETSRAAAESLSGHSELCLNILAVLRSSVSGLIVDDVKAMVERNLERSFDRSTIAARFTELKERGMIYETAETKKTPRGRAATVFKLTIKGRDHILNN